MSNKLNSAIQTLEPGKLVTLYEIDGESIGAGIYRFHADRTAGVITFGGLNYSPWPMEADGFEATGTGTAASPKLTMANVDGFITALCLSFRNMIGAKFIRRRTLSQFLDGQPEADYDEQFPQEIWRIEQLLGRDPTQATFELASDIDFRGQMIPARQIVANVCPWRYRGPECGYNGGPVADINDNPTSDPTKDNCSRFTRGCKFRFGEYGELPFGGFPSAGLVR